MRVGEFVCYTHWKFDPLLSPKVRFGIVLNGPDKSGRMLVLFGEQRMWVWSGDLSPVEASDYVT